METSKTKNGKSEHPFLFHLKFVKMKTFFPILALKQPNSEKRIFAAYKYSRRSLKRILLPKCLSNNLSAWLFNDWLTPSQILTFSNLVLHKFILVSNSNTSVSKFFDLCPNSMHLEFTSEFASISDT